jgi:hypothetical protein
MGDDIDDVSAAVRLLGLPPDLRPIAEEVARTICGHARVQSKISRQAPTRAHVRGKLEEVAKHASALRKALENYVVADSLIHASYRSDASDGASVSNCVLADIPRLLNTLPDGLIRLQVAAMGTRMELGLKGRRGKVKADWTYRLSPAVIFTRMAMHLWMVAKPSDQEPSEKSTKFKEFLDALWRTALPDCDDQDWSRAIRTARAHEQTDERQVAHFAMRLVAGNVVLPLVNAIRAR